MVRFALALVLYLLAMPLSADPLKVADLTDPQERLLWRFFTDGVMGGVSTGEARIDADGVTLTGTVSTANNGGFIQVRREAINLPDGVEALRIRVRGDGQTYFVHLRTRATRLPWQYYQAEFIAPQEWTEITLPLSSFRPSGALLPEVSKSGSIRTVALVAYGRDHVASVSLSSVWAETGESDDGK
jgi:hypothetical protein